MDKKNKKTIVWLILFIFMITMFLTVATYSYFVTSDYYYGTFEIDVESKGVDTLAFISTEEVDIVADVSNFSKGFGSDVSGEAKLGAIFDTTKERSKYCYEVSFQMPNEAVFTYTNGNVPELTVSIQKSSDDIFYETVISNLDITTKTGTIKLPTSIGGNNYKFEIETTKNNTKRVYYKAIVTFVYFPEVDQSLNDLKTYHAKFSINRVDC